ncbi:MAG: hypothetical protein K8S98_18320 [Planctomycetes bacterium]|nr:hypothetical protein [Planctomycetota bacterium]
MSHRFFVAVCATIALVARSSGAPFQDIERVLVDGKSLGDVEFVGAPWTPLKTGGIEGVGEGNRVTTRFEVGAGDFSVHLELAIDQLGDQQSAFAFASDAFLGFDDHDRKLVLAGPRFGDKFAVLGDAERAWKPGEAFDLDVERRGARVTFALDGKPLHEFDFHAGAVGRMSVSPGKTRLRLLAWRIRGAFVELAPSPDVEALRVPIDSAIERGVAYLLSTQQRDGSWSSGQPQYPSGQTALAIYALSKSGLELDSPPLVRALRFLDAHPPFETYSTGLTLMAYEATHDPKSKERMRPLAKALLAWQRSGLWSYPTEWNGTRWTDVQAGRDLSNTQYAVLGLRAAAAAGIEVPMKVWIDLIDGVLRLQETPIAVDVARAAGDTSSGKRTIAGFRYNGDSGAKGSMTAAGVSALAIARDALGPKLTGGQGAEVAKAIQLGVAWLGHHFRADAHPFGEEAWLYYWLYGVERVGGLLDLDRLGSHAWYVEGARFLLAKQNADGDWSTPYGGMVRSGETDTCYALLFLRRATAHRPVTGGLESSFQTKAVVDDDVRVAFAGRGAFEFWIGGFGERVLAENGGGALDGLRVASVEYVCDGRVLARVAGDPKKAWSRERFRAQFELVYPGTYAITARVRLVAPDAPVDATEPTRSIESKPVQVRSLGLSTPWMNELVERRARNLLLGKEMTVTTSSVNGDDVGERAFDGLEGSRWMCKNDDPAPMLILELPKPIQASQLVLWSHCAHPRLRGEHDVLRRVSVRVNRNKDVLEVTAGDDELAPLVLQFGKPTAVQRLELRIVERTPGKSWAGHIGFTEIELYK